MLTALGIILPVIATIAIGFSLVRMKVFKRNDISVLNRFVFMVAAPALLFRNIATTSIPEDLPWGLWVSYYGAMFVCLAFGLLASRLVFRKSLRDPKAHIIMGFGSSFSNTVMLGIPIILTAFGERASIPLFLVLAFHGLLLFSVTSLALEFADQGSLTPGEIGRMFFRLLADQQVMLALLAGVIWNFSGLGLVEPIDRFLELLGQATIPVALIAVGGTLANVHVRANIAAALQISVIKLLLQPLLVFFLARYVFELSALYTATITVLAAMPSGIFTSVFADRYQAAMDIASSAILLSTLLSALSIALWLGFFSDQLLS